MKRILLYLAAATCLAVYAIPAKAVTADGITYSLANPSDNNFILSITGINSASDTEGGRVSINAIAFSTLNFNITGGSIAGGTFLGGGLNSTGCNGDGGFICFDINVPVAGSTLDIPFHLDGSLAGWAAATSFKIDWIGSQRNYDLVSLPFGAPPAAVPVPPAAILFGSGLAGLGVLMRKRRKAMQQSAAA